MNHPLQNHRNQGLQVGFLRGLSLPGLLPHPSPLPLGEGVFQPSAARINDLGFVHGGIRFSLAQRERAGVREIGSLG